MEEVKKEAGNGGMSINQFIVLAVVRRLSE